MNTASVIGYVTASGAFVVGLFGAYNTKIKAKAESQYIYAQTSDVVFDQLREELDRLNKIIVDDRAITAELNFKVASQQSQIIDYQKDAQKNEEKILCMERKVEDLTQEVARCAEDKAILIRQHTEAGIDIRAEDKKRFGIEEREK